MKEELIRGMAVFKLINWSTSMEIIAQLHEENYSWVLPICLAKNLKS